MSHRLLNLRHVPDDEAADVRAMLEANGIAFYETPSSIWGIAAGGIFVEHDADMARARALMADYQAQRRERARAEYAAAVRDGTAETFWTQLRDEPVRVVLSLVAIVVLLGLVALPVLLLRAKAAEPAAQPADVALARMDCGGPKAPVGVAAFSDTLAWPDLEVPLMYGCYLVRHGDDYLLWDTGAAADGSATAPAVSLADQLAAAGIVPGDIDYVGISHYHNDHTGQLPAFTGSTLLIGHGDWESVRPATAPEGTPQADYDRRRAPFAAWTDGQGRVEALRRPQHDVFGDGRVVMISLPGHTPGHHGLLVRLAGMGAVLLTGDATHFHENYDTDGIPNWNTDRADSLASLHRLKALADNLDATVVIQHDRRDAGKLPTFPAFAE